MKSFAVEYIYLYGISVYSPPAVAKCHARRLFMERESIEKEKGLELLLIGVAIGFLLGSIGVISLSLVAY